MKKGVEKGVAIIPDEFKKVIKDFIRDLKTTYPEYIPIIDKWWKNETEFSHIEDELERNTAIEDSLKKSIQSIFEFCQKKIPPRFFDILYKK